MQPQSQPQTPPSGQTPGPVTPAPFPKERTQAPMPLRPAKRNLDIWLVMVMVVMVLTIGGAMLMTTQSILSRMDEMSVRQDGQIAALQTELFSARKQLIDLTSTVRATQDLVKESAAESTLAAAKVPAGR